VIRSFEASSHALCSWRRRGALGAASLPAVPIAASRYATLADRTAETKCVTMPRLE